MSSRLLAVDLGVRTGLALFEDHEILWCRSHNFGDRQRLKRAAYRVIAECSPLAHLALEGDRQLGSHWERAAKKRSPTVEVHWVSPETWRPHFFHERQRRSGTEAKAEAVRLASVLISAHSSRGVGKTKLNDDAAEACLIGEFVRYTVENASNSQS